MSTYLWGLIANPLASIAAGILLLLLLLLFKRHKDAEGGTDTNKIVGALLFGISLYTLIVLAYGHFVADRPINLGIESFGSERIAWLFVGLIIDHFARLYRIFDPPKRQTTPPAGQ